MKKDRSCCFCLSTKWIFINMWRRIGPVCFCLSTKWISLPHYKWLDETCRHVARKIPFWTQKVTNAPQATGFFHFYIVLFRKVTASDHHGVGAPPPGHPGYTTAKLLIVPRFVTKISRLLDFSPPLEEKIYFHQLWKWATLHWKLQIFPDSWQKYWDY